MRALIGARTSTINADKVSHLTQVETGGKYATDRAWNVVGGFSDLGVSATVSPFERPDLGPWLTDKSHEWDVAIWSKVDRAFRSAYDCAAVGKWAEENRKVLVFTDDGLTLDFRNGGDDVSSMMARMFVMLSAMFAEMELKRLTQRATDRETALRATDRFAHGSPPFGYRTVAHPSGSGKALEPDPEQRRVLRDLGDKLLAGDSFNNMTRWLNDQSVASNRSDTAKWAPSNVKALLTSHKTQGIKTHNGEPVLDAEGLPIRMAEPTFDADTWTQIQAKVAEREYSGPRRVHSTNPVLGIGYCECGASLTRKVKQYKGKDYVNYRCGRTPYSCRGVTLKESEALDALERLMTGTFGAMQATRRVFVAGSDNSADLATVEQSLARLRRESDAGLIDDEDEYFTRLGALTARKRELSEQPNRPAGWETITEDETYAERYAVADAEGRRDIVKGAGIRLTVHAEGEPTVSMPGTAGELLWEVFGTEEVRLSSLTENTQRVSGVVRAHVRGDLS